MSRVLTATASFSLLLIADLSYPTPALAGQAEPTIDIPAGPIGVSLARFTQITGISIGLPGAMPNVRTRGVDGQRSPDAALKVMLDGTGFRARRAGGTYRIEAVRPISGLSLEAVPPAQISQSFANLVITGQKQPQPLVAAPLSVSVITPGGLKSDAKTPSSREIVLESDGLSMTNLGPGRNRQFIRGVADSPFNGQSQSTVAVQVDEARVTFDAPDPDLRLIDVERVEILKGPQGPLYGTGALGGIYHIVTRRPDLSDRMLTTRISGQAVAHGGLGYGVEAVGNMPIVDDRLAVRGVFYRLRDAGWIDNADGRKDSNSAFTAGGRIDLAWRPTDNWLVDLGYTTQDISVRDSQYVLSGAKTLRRDNPFPEPTVNDFEMIHGTVEGEVGTLHLLSATSYVDHTYQTTLNASDAASRFGLSGLVKFFDDRAYTLFNQELRLSSGGDDRWLAGVALLRATSRQLAQIADDRGGEQVAQEIDRDTTELSVFGEATWQLPANLSATLGARLTDSIAEDRAAEVSSRRMSRENKLIFSPSATLSRPLGKQGVVYLRHAHAVRPGRLATSSESATGRFDADGIDSIDLGFRRTSIDDRLTTSASLFAMRWTAIQSDYLLPNGLISTRNAGNARILGIEAAIDWNMGSGWRTTGGVAAHDARLISPDEGIEIRDVRLPVAPRLAGRIALSKHVTMGDWSGQMTVQANYIGGARLSLDSDLDRRMGKYGVMAAHGELSHGRWTLAARFDNLLDVRGDSFAFGNPFSIMDGRQYTPVRPRTMTLSIARDW